MSSRRWRLTTRRLLVAVAAVGLLLGWLVRRPYPTRIIDLTDECLITWSNETRSQMPKPLPSCAQVVTWPPWVSWVRWPDGQWNGYLHPSDRPPHRLGIH